MPRPAVIPAILRWLQARPHAVASLVLIAYLAILQPRFIWSGDVWAEGYAEYLVNALTFGWKTFFSLGWANYFNLIPKVLSNLYVTLHLPVGYIDYFYRATVVLYAVASTAFIAHPSNRRLIPSDSLRILLALATIEILYHVSSFSFINVWYIGFVVVVMICLNPRPMRSGWQIPYGIFAIAAVLTKPSIILLPLVAYRAYRTKEYVAGGIIAGAIGLQTLLMALSYPSVTLEPIRLTTKAAILALGSGLVALKALNIPPVSLAIVALAMGVLMGLVWYVGRTRGWLLASTLVATFGLATYTQYFVPDLPAPAFFRQFQDIFHDDFKLQRAIMPSFLVLLLIYLAADSFLRFGGRWRWLRPVPPVAIFASLLALVAVQYRPIDLQRAVFAADISQYRHSLNARQSVCVPIPPHPGWDNYLKVPAGNWWFQHYGGCIGRHYEQSPAPGLSQTFPDGLPLVVAGQSDLQLKSVLVALYNPRPRNRHHLQLRDQATGHIYTAIVPAKTNGEALSYVAFNLHGLEPQQQYHLLLTDVTPGRPLPLKAALFADRTPAYYELFMGYPNLSEQGRP